MTRLAVLVTLLTALAGLSACGEKPQTLGARKTDVPAYQGAQNRFVAPGWTTADKSSWEQSLKARMYNTQNEYTKIN